MCEGEPGQIKRRQLTDQGVLSAAERWIGALRPLGLDWHALYAVREALRSKQLQQAQVGERHACIAAIAAFNLSSRDTPLRCMPIARLGHHLDLDTRTQR
jgi:hypothetical protein